MAAAISVVDVALQTDQRAGAGNLKGHRMGERLHGQWQCLRRRRQVAIKPGTARFEPTWVRINDFRVFSRHTNAKQCRTTVNCLRANPTCETYRLDAYLRQAAASPSDGWEVSEP